MKIKNIFILLVLFIVFLAAGFIFFSTARTSSFNPEIEQKLDQLMADSMKKYNSPAMTLGIWVPGRGSFVKAKGVADLSTGRVINVKERFRIGSMTKTFTATVILQLVDEGKLSLDDRLSKFFPGMPNAKTITIRQMLDMTSGLYNYTEIPWVEKALFENRFRKWMPLELVAVAAAQKPYFAPGKGFHYSNTNYILLGMIIEEITGNKLGNEFKRRIIDRLRLANTFFPDGAEIKGDIIHGYMFKDGKAEDWTREDVSWGWAAGAMISKMYDLKTYVRALCDGTFLSDKLQRERLTSWVKMGSPRKMRKFGMSTLRYGLGVFTAGGFVGHNGGLPGYVNMAVYNPENGASILFMLNTQPEEGEATVLIFKEVFKILFPDREL